MPLRPYLSPLLSRCSTPCPSHPSLSKSSSSPVPTRSLPPNPQDLYRAVSWPLDSMSQPVASLPALYISMLQCCLLEQMDHDPPAKGR